VLSTIVTSCNQSMMIFDHVFSNAMKGSVLTPTLFSASQLSTLVQQEYDSSLSLAYMLYHAPLTMLSLYWSTEMPLTAQGLFGLRPPTTVLAQSIPLVSFPADNLRRTWFSFTADPCWAQHSQSLCERVPFCYYDPSSGIFPCQSTLCPADLDPVACGARPQCISEPLNPADPTSNATVCVDRECIYANSPTECFETAQAPVSPVPQRCQTFAEPSSGAVSCQSLPLTCGSFATEQACAAYAPPAYCRWNAAAAACEFIASSHCPPSNSSNSSSNASTCLARDAVVDSFSPYIPAQLASSWPPLTLGNDSFDIQQLGIIQADVLTFTARRNISSVGYAMSDEPLWRTAVNDSAQGGCSCFTNPSCASPPQTFRGPGDNFTSSWQWHCTRLDTVGSWTTNALRSSIWASGGLGFRIDAPLADHSAFDSVGDAMLAAFLRNTSFSLDHHAYFNACAPLTCSYSVRGHPPAVQVIASLAGLIGGLTVVLRALTDLVAYTCCKPCVLRHLRRFPSHSDSDGGASDANPFDRVLLFLRSAPSSTSDDASLQRDQLREQSLVGLPHTRRREK
jgi:hypothetical protein